LENFEASWLIYSRMITWNGWLKLSIFGSRYDPQSMKPLHPATCAPFTGAGRYESSRAKADSRANFSILAIACWRGSCIPTPAETMQKCKGSVRWRNASGRNWVRRTHEAKQADFS